MKLRRSLSLVTLVLGALAALALLAGARASHRAAEYRSRWWAQRLAAPWATGDDFTLHSGWLQGRITGAAGQPLAGALVTLARTRPPDVPATDAPRPILIGRTGPTGRFRFKIVPAADYVLTGAAGGHAPVSRGPFPVQPRTTTHLELQLDRGGVRLSGRVRNGAGQPLADARITVIGAPDEQAVAPPVFQARADSGGAYELSLQPGAYRVRVEAAGHAAVDASLSLPSPGHQDFALLPGAAITGHVLERAPAAGAEVSLLGPVPAPTEWRRVIADPRGAFSIDDLPAGSYQIWARSGSLAAGPVHVSVDAGKATPIAPVALKAALSISGHILDATGAPIEGADVCLAGEPALFQTGHARADAEGRFTIGGLLPGRVTVSVTSEHHAGRRRQLTLNETSVDLGTIRLASEAMILGKVVDARGAPVEGARVIVSVLTGEGEPFSSWTHSDWTGQFEIRNVPAGKLTVHARSARGLFTAPEQTLVAGAIARPLLPVAPPPP